MKWILIFIMFNNGMHHVQSQPIMYDEYDKCRMAAAKIRNLLNDTKPNETSYSLAFCVSVPENV